MLAKLIAWLRRHYQWVFSGIGVVALLGLLNLVARISSTDRPAARGGMATADGALQSQRVPGDSVAGEIRETPTSPENEPTVRRAFVEIGESRFAMDIGDYHDFAQPPLRGVRLELLEVFETKGEPTHFLPGTFVAKVRVSGVRLTGGRYVESRGNDTFIIGPGDYDQQGIMGINIDDFSSDAYVINLVHANLKKQSAEFSLKTIGAARK